MWMDSVSGYLFQLVVLGSPVLAIYALRVQWHIREDFKGVYYWLLAILFTLVYVSGFSIGYYKNYLILEYILFLGASTYFYSQRNDAASAICLGVLTVFLNSYYWELPYHLTEILSVGFHVGMLTQFWRLYPLTYFIPNYSVGSGGKKWLIYGFGFSAAMMFLRKMLPWYYVIYLHSVNRVVCLGVLLKVFVEARRGMLGS